jgi:hypothetical protein
MERPLQEAIQIFAEEEKRGLSAGWNPMCHQANLLNLRTGMTEMNQMSWIEVDRNYQV